MENSKAKKQLLDASEKLMLKKGFSATTVDEICRKAKLTKGSFFHYFESKEGLGKAVLERFCCSHRNKVGAACCHLLPDDDPLQRLYTHIEFAIDSSKAKSVPDGCLLGVFSQELSHTSPHMRSLCAQGFREWGKILRRDFVVVKKQCKSKKTFDVNRMVIFFLALLEGSQILAKVMRDNRIVGKNLRYFKRYLKYVLEK